MLEKGFKKEFSFVVIFLHFLLTQCCLNVPLSMFLDAGSVWVFDQRAVYTPAHPVPGEANTHGDKEGNQSRETVTHSVTHMERNLL